MDRLTKRDENRRDQRACSLPVFTKTNRAPPTRVAFVLVVLLRRDQIVGRRLSPENRNNYRRRRKKGAFPLV